MTKVKVFVYGRRRQQRRRRRRRRGYDNSSPDFRHGELIMCKQTRSKDKSSSLPPDVMSHRTVRPKKKNTCVYGLPTVPNFWPRP